MSRVWMGCFVWLVLSPSCAVDTEVPAIAGSSTLRRAMIATSREEGSRMSGFHLERRGDRAHARRVRGLEGALGPKGLDLDGGEGVVLSTREVLCDGRSRPIPPGEAEVDPRHRNRANLALGEAVTEWMVAGPLGLEHGYDVDLPGCTRLRIGLSVQGARPLLSEDSGGPVVRLLGADGLPHLRYGDLFAVDAKGTELPARFGVVNDRVWIEVETAKATWPVVVDPLIFAESTVLAPDLDGDGATGDRFGSVTAVWGDTAVVGVPDDDLGTNADQGSAYVFVRSGGTWAFQQKLFVPEGAQDDRFGASVAVEGDTLVVGASTAWVGALESQGAVYVFVRSGGAWRLSQRLIAPDGTGFDRFGSTLALESDALLVGAPSREVNPTTVAGAVYVFARSGGAWVLQQKLTAADGAHSDAFGSSVALFGDTALVGAPEHQVGTFSRQGAAYVFVRSGASWTEQAKLVLPNGAQHERAARAVSLGNDTAVIGSSAAMVDTNASQGAVHVFARTGTLWAHQQRLTGSEGAAGDGFGHRVRVLGGRLVVSAPQHRVSLSTQGAAYLFVRNGSTWVQTQKIVSAAAQLGERLGSSLAMSEDTLLLGAPVRRDGVATELGAVTFVGWDGSQWTGQQHHQRVVGAAHESFGYSVAIEADRAVVGAPGDVRDNGVGIRHGAAYVFVRDGGGWRRQQRLVASPVGEANGNGFGCDVAIKGDWILVGARTSDVADRIDQGVAYLFRWDGTAWVEHQKLVADDLRGGGFGESVALSEDVAVVAAPFQSSSPAPYTQHGSAYVFVRSGTTWTQTQKLLASDPAAYALFGDSVALSQDTLLVGASGGYSVSIYSAELGAAYVFVRANGTFTEQAKLTAADGARFHWFGRSVSVSGDTAVVGANAAGEGGAQGLGAAYVFVRAGTTWSQQAKIVPPKALERWGFGVNLALFGDRLAVASAQAIGGNSPVHLFERTGFAWAHRQTLVDSLDRYTDEYPYPPPLDVAMDGTRILTGAPSRYGPPPMGNPLEGRAFLWEDRLTDGDACAADVDCASRLCVDGVCCATPCGGSSEADCQACSVARGGQLDGVCGTVRRSTPCRASAGVCDPAETCDGFQLECPADAKADASVLCRDAQGICGVPERCDGSSNDCPEDGHLASGMPCQGGVCLGDACVTPAEYVAQGGGPPGSEEDAGEGASQPVSGCGCGSGSMEVSWGLPGLLVAWLALRRRRAREELRLNQRLLTLMLLAALVQGCSGGSGPPRTEEPGGTVPGGTQPGDPDAGGTPPTGVTPTGQGLDASVPAWLQQQACLAMLEATCEQKRGCGDPVGADTCLEQARAYCPKLVFAEGSTFTIERALDCAGERLRQDCAEARHFPPSCGPPGLLPGDAPCRFDSQCESGRCSKMGACGFCLYLQPPDAGCPKSGAATCGPGRFCPDSLTGCVPAPPAPEVVYLEEGEPCPATFDAGVGYGAVSRPCAPGLMCPSWASSTSIRACTRLPREGQACLDSFFCPEPLVCMFPDPSADVRLCLAPRQSHQPCQPGQCAQGLACTLSGVCGAPSPLGSGCKWNEQCADTAYCDLSSPAQLPLGTCTTGLPAGSDCGRFAADAGWVSPTCAEGSCEFRFLPDAGQARFCELPPGTVGDPCSASRPCYGNLLCGASGVCEHHWCGTP